MAEAFPPQDPSNLPSAALPSDAPVPVPANAIRSIISRVSPALLSVWRLTWPGRIATFALSIISLKAIWDWVLEWGSAITGYINSIFFWRQPDSWLAAWQAWFDMKAGEKSQLAKVVHRIMSQIMGFPVSEGTVQNALDGGVGGDDLNNFADVFVKSIENVFDLDQVAAGYQSREAGTAETDNFRRFVGLNLRTHMGKIAAEMSAPYLPFQIGDGLNSIADAIEGVLGLEDAQEEILEPLMEKLIIGGLEKKYNRIILPTDLSPEDAISAHIRGYLLDGEFEKIMNNEGIRPDIRPILRNLQAKNLTEADFRDLYQRGAWAEADVTAAYRANGYLVADATLKTQLIVDDRAWTLRKELLNVKESQFVHGVLTEAQLRSFLSTMYFSQLEEDLEIEIAKGKASMGGALKPKQIAGTFNVAPWRVKSGASAVMSWNIRNADNITISGIGSVGERGERVIQPTASQTYILDASSATDSASFEAVVEVGGVAAVRLPSASFSASPGRITLGTPVELKWITSGADSVSIDGVGIVADAGAMAVYPFVSTIYTLRATNAAGTTVRQDIVFVSLPDIGFGEEDRPRITFSIIPTVVRPSQPQAELNWEITRADGGTLTFPDGTTQSVSQNGALIVTATASGIYTLEASNAFGATKNQEGLIWDAPAVPAP